MADEFVSTCNACERPLIMDGRECTCMVCSIYFCISCSGGQLLVCKTPAEKHAYICPRCVCNRWLATSRFEYVSWIEADSVRRFLEPRRGGNKKSAANEK